MMRNIVLVLAFGTSAFGRLFAHRVNRDSSIHRRQAFEPDPDTETGFGESCEDAFGPGYFECIPETATSVAFCYSPSEGESCCDNLWSCPAGSYCLVDGFCCLDIDDPEECAIANTIELPTSFETETPTFTPTGSPDNTTATAETTPAITPTVTSPRNTDPTVSVDDNSAPQGDVGFVAGFAAAIGVAAAAMIL